MAMSQKVICPGCGLTVARGARYCPRCGEPLDPEIVLELQQLYATITDLNARIARGHGQETITDLRDEYQTRYLAMRSAKPTAAPTTATAGSAAPITTPLGAPTGAAPASAVPPAAPIGAPVTPGVAITPRRVAQPYATPVTPTPVFSWRAFVAEQAIAIMAYLGGFLLLVATLTFEIGGWQVLPDPIKFAAVSVVYIVFAALGFALRQSQHLRTVGRAYLAVFALMTPLVALAAYRFILQGQGFSATGMLCLSSFYAAAVYLLLAWRTRFSTYSYLGWVAFIVGAGAIIPWSAAPIEWTALDLALVGLVMLAPRRLTEMDRRGEWQTDWRVVAEPATQLGAVISIAAGLGAALLGVSIWGTYGSGLASGPSLAAFALAACTMAPLATAWSLTLRDRQRRPPEALVGVVDWCTPAFAALAMIALVVWASESSGQTTTRMAYTLALLGVAEIGLALALRRARPQRIGLRYGVEGLALALTSIGAIIVFQRPDPNAPLIVALTAALIVSAIGAAYENALGWGLVAGLFLSLDAHTIFDALVPNLPTATFSPQNDTLPGVLIAAASLQTALALIIWLVALILGEILPRTATPAQPAPQRVVPVWPPAATAQRAAADAASPITPNRPTRPVAPATPPYTRPRAFLAPLYLTALGDALFASLLLVPHTSGYQTAILLVFAVAGLIAGWRIRAGAEGTVVGGLAFGFFGFFATLTALVNNGNQLWIAGYMIAFALASLAIRRLLGRGHSIGPYVITCWAAFIGGLALFNFPYYFGSLANAAIWAPLGVPFSAWALLGVAALLAVYALWERQPGLMAPPALVVLFAQLHTLDSSVSPWIAAIFALALAPIGLALRWRRGSGWGVAWYAVAVPASLIAVYRFEAQGAGNWPVLAELLLIVFAALAYVVAWRERLAWLTIAAILYALGALILVPAQNQFAATMVLTIGAAALAIIVRVRGGRRWALALYAIGVLGTIFAGPRVTPPDGAHIEATLLVFAALAYGIAYFEDTPVAGIAPVVYALFAVIFQPDPHGLLPLALILAVVGLIAGRVVGPRWSWPAYVAAAIAAVGTAYQGQSQPTFEAGALLLLAVVAYVVAAIESRADALPLAFALGALGVAATANAAHWSSWEVTLAYAALAWVYALAGRLWRTLPWLRARGGAWWERGLSGQAQAQWRDPRFFGEVIHRGAAVITAAGALVAAWLTGQSFTTHAATTQATAIALLSLAGLLAYYARELRRQSLYYIAGEFVALALTWQARWFGADNLQWFVLAPGSYHLLIGALLPADEKMGRPRRLGQAASALGALILLAPTLGQSFQAQPNWLYALILTFEALVIAGIGVGTRSRLLVVVGTAFIGLAALRGAALAVGSGLPTPLVIGVVALLLMGLATWLSLRARRNANQAGG